MGLYAPLFLASVEGSFLDPFATFYRRIYVSSMDESLGGIDKQVYEAIYNWYACKIILYFDIPIDNKLGLKDSCLIWLEAVSRSYHWSIFK